MTSGPYPQRSERGPGGARSRDSNRALRGQGDREVLQGFRNWGSGSVGEDTFQLQEEVLQRDGCKERRVAEKWPRRRVALEQIGGAGLRGHVTLPLHSSACG